MEEPNTVTVLTDVQFLVETLKLTLGLTSVKSAVLEKMTLDQVKKRLIRGFKRDGDFVLSAKTGTTFIYKSKEEGGNPRLKEQDLTAENLRKHFPGLASRGPIFVVFGNRRWDFSLLEVVKKVAF